MTKNNPKKRNCPQCHGEIPRKAKKCMHCGSKAPLQWKDMTKYEKISVIVFFSIIFLWLLFALTGNTSNNPNTEKQSDSTTKSVNSQDERAKKIEKQFSAWDGSHRNLTKLIKSVMNDPSSFEHVKTSYWDMEDHLVVLTIYRGTNIFGGKVENGVKAKISLEGEIVEIMEEY